MALLIVIADGPGPKEQQRLYLIAAEVNIQGHVHSVSDSAQP